MAVASALAESARVGLALVAWTALAVVTSGLRLFFTYSRVAIP
ncbi:hypothetical protein ACIBED_13880 [Rhodococcus coprophilus]|nr:hypothetical protein [Rhodococcus coprophilus]MBM7459405.1 hypothetical protein [Rhodococcus coprophilus]